jgi:hypothetical protein
MPYPLQAIFRFDNAKTLNAAVLRKLVMIKPGYKTEGVISWGNSFKVNAAVTTRKDYGTLTLSYIIDNKPITAAIEITSRISNLDGKSLIWQFICPFTNKISRKLYFNGTHFVNRSSIKDGMYNIQTQSKKARETEELYSYLLGDNDIYTQLAQRHLKKTYNGKTTKRYSKLMYWKNRIDKITAYQMEFLYLYGYLPEGN